MSYTLHFWGTNQQCCAWSEDITGGLPFHISNKQEAITFQAEKDSLMLICYLFPNRAKKFSVNITT